MRFLIKFVKNRLFEVAKPDRGRCQAVCVDDVIAKACMCWESIKDVTRQPFCSSFVKSERNGRRPEEIKLEAQK